MLHRNHLQVNDAHKFLLSETKLQHGAYSDVCPQQFEAYTFLLKYYIEGLRNFFLLIGLRHSHTNQQASPVGVS